MRVDGALQILAAGRVLHSQYRFRDQLPGHGTNYVPAEYFVGVACGHALREAGGLLQGARAAAGEEREHAGLVFAAARLDLLFGEADPGDLRCGIDDRWNHLVIDFAETAGDQVRDHHALLLALVGQHRAPYAIPDRPHALHARAAGVIDADEAAFVQLNPGIGPEQIPAIGSATDRDHQPLDTQVLRAFGILVRDIDRCARHRSARDLGAQANVEAEFPEVPQRLLGELLHGECQA